MQYIERIVRVVVVAGGHRFNSWWLLTFQFSVLYLIIEKLFYESNH